jgi:hypothetical protein
MNEGRQGGGSRQMICARDTPNLSFHWGMTFRDIESVADEYSVYAVLM